MRDTRLVSVIGLVVAVCCAYAEVMSARRYCSQLRAMMALDDESRGEKPNAQTDSRLYSE